MNCDKIIENIERNLESYIGTHRLEALVLGVSGGIDSALCAALAEPVCQKNQIRLVGRSLPIVSNKVDELERAKQIGIAFCDDFREENLGDVFQNTAKTFLSLEGISNDPKREKIRLGNIKARIRMIYLYNLASIHKGLVLSTDNLTELYLGFWTLHGDVGDYGMIQQLFKTEVYVLAEHLVNRYRKDPATLLRAEALDACIHAVSTDGLGISNSSLEQMGAPTFREVDHILRETIFNHSKDYETHPVILRFKASEFKRHHPFNIPREELFA
jgi:NAD+ synthase